MHFLQVRSLKDKENFFIKKNTLEKAIDKFLDKIPDYWIPPANYSSALKDLVVYIDDLRDKIEKLETIKMTIQNISYDFFNTNSIKKLLNFNNY
jgi:hypothetical protein